MTKQNVIAMSMAAVLAVGAGLQVRHNLALANQVQSPGMLMTNLSAVSPTEARHEDAINRSMQDIDATVQELANRIDVMPEAKWDHRTWNLLRDLQKQDALLRELVIANRARKVVIAPTENCVRPQFSLRRGNRLH